MECDYINENRNLMIEIENLNKEICRKSEIITNLIAVIISYGDESLIKKSNECLKNIV